MMAPPGVLWRLALASAIAPVVIVFAALAVAVVAELASAAGAAPIHVTPHLSFTVRLEPIAAVAGERVSLIVDVHPHPGIKVYAPGTSYRAVAVVLDADPSIWIEDTVYPLAETFLFEPLAQEVLVYTKPFQLVTGLTMTDGVDGKASPQRRRHVMIRGELQYQACNATSCFLPESAAFERRLGVQRDGDVRLSEGRMGRFADRDED